MNLQHHHISNALSRYFAMLLMAMIVAVAPSCRSSRTASSGQPGGTSSNGGYTTSSTLSESYKALRTSYAAEWQALELPLTVKASGLPITLSGTAYMRRGEEVSLSLRLIGMEVVAARITRDSVVVVDKHNKRHVQMALSELTSRFPVTVDNIQNLLLGRVFLLGHESLPAKIDPSLFRVETDTAMTAGTWAILPQVAKDAGYDYAFVLNQVPELDMALARFSSGRMLRVDYSQLQSATPYGGFAEDVTVRYPGKDGTGGIEGKLQWRFGKARWNGDARPIKVTIPKQSRKADIKSIVRLLEGGAQ